MVSSYTQPSPRTSIMSNNIITIMIFMHSAHSGEGAHYHIPAFKYRHFFGFCTLNKMHLCPLYTVFLLLQARYIISMYLLATHHPLPLGQPTQVRSQKSSSETFTRLLWTVSSHPSFSPAGTIHDAYQPITNNSPHNTECSESWPVFVVSRCQDT